MAERYAIYFAPPTSSELWRRAAIWLGRDPATGSMIEADIGGLDPEHRQHWTRSARRYGFHATLKAPMVLDTSLEGKDLDRALKAWVTTNAPVDIGRLRLASIDGFLALIPVTQSEALTDFAATVVNDFDGFRAPLSAAELERRLGASTLTLRQRALLEQFGYPYVAEEFQFHMTLTDRLPPEDEASFTAATEQLFAFATAEPLLLDRLVLFHEAEPGAPFTRLRDYPLAGDFS
jgi:putative phosphonate metabolism protein